MNIYLYYLFFAEGYGCVIVRNIYTITFIAYLLKIINFKILRLISSVMFIPLIISLFGEYVSCLYFEIDGTKCKNIKKIEDLFQSSLDADSNIMKRVDMIRYLYKIVILYLVVKYIKPEFNFINIAIPVFFIVLYFYFYPLDKSHLGRKMKFNNNLLVLFILLGSLGIFYLLSKIYNKINIIHMIMLYLTYILLYFLF